MIKPIKTDKNCLASYIIVGNDAASLLRGHLSASIERKTFHGYSSLFFTLNYVMYSIRYCIVWR